jgi:hypothetical protein
VWAIVFSYALHPFINAQRKLLSNKLLTNIMCLSCSVTRCFVIIVLCVTALPARADFDELYKLEMGRAVVDFDSKISVNSRDDSINKELDFEDTAGFDSQLRIGVVKGSWRMADRHRLSLLYAPIKRATELTTSKDIEIDGNIIRAGASLGTSVKTHVFDIEYLYSYYKRPNLELAVSAGIYWMNSLTEFTASGQVVIEGSGQEEFRSDYQANQRLVAPLPLLGLSASYAITPQWIAHAYARYLDVTISDIEGRILSFNLKTEYYFTDHVALGAAYTVFDLSVRHNGVVFFNSLSYEYSGLQAYLALKY